MKKIFLTTLIFLLCVPLFPFSVSAVEFDLPIPELYNRPILSTTPSDYKYANRYKLYIDSDSNFDFLRYESYRFGFHYYVNRAVKWGLGSYYAENESKYHITLDPIDYTKDYYRLSTPNIDLSDSLCFVSLLYPDIIVPAQADNYLKVTFYMHTNFDTNNLLWSDYPASYKQFVDEYTQAQYLCGFVYRTTNSSYEWSLPTSHMVPSAVSVRDSGTTITNKNFVGDNMEFTYYFNLSGGFLSDLLNFEGVGLLIRFPFWFGPNASNGVRVLGNTNLPVKYEIISPNDYSQELENIQNSVTTVNTSVLQVYDALTNNPNQQVDTVIITGFKSELVEVDNVVNKYDDAQTRIESLVNNVTLPSIQSDISNSLNRAPDVVESIGNVFTNSYFAGALVIVFSFCAINLILYGISKGD